MISATALALFSLLARCLHLQMSRRFQAVFDLTVKAERFFG